MNNVLILGADGMLGNAIYKYLNEKKINAIGTSRKDNSFLYFNVEEFNYDYLGKLINKHKPEYIINCIGYIRPGDDALSYKKALIINSVFPQNLSTFCLKNKINLIHFSTDCIFNGDNGPYKEDALADESGIYGVSKFLGEVRELPNITIRTSIIGHEFGSNRNLLNWFLNNEEKEINGFSKVYWNGISTLVAAKVIFKIINDKIKFNKPIIQLASNTVSKYELLNIFKKVYQKEIVINEISNPVINKTLIPSTEQDIFFKDIIKSLDDQIFELKEFYE